jgi:alpha/beta superfamily hydrolase
MDHPVLAEMAWASARAGFPTLRFNFRGTGASQGRRGGDPERLADAEAALRVLEENTGVARVAVSSFGASAPTIVELQRLHPGINGLCFTSPAEIASSDLSRIGMPVLAVVGERDPSIPPAAWAAAIGEAGGRLEIIRGADAHFQSGLPEMGKSVVRWLVELGGA